MLDLFPFLLVGGVLGVKLTLMIEVLKPLVRCSLGSCQRPLPLCAGYPQAFSPLQFKVMPGTISVFNHHVMILLQVHLRKPCYDFYFL